MADALRARNLNFAQSIKGLRSFEAVAFVSISRKSSNIKKNELITQGIKVVSHFFTSEFCITAIVIIQDKIVYCEVNTETVENTVIVVQPSCLLILDFG